MTLSTETESDVAEKMVELQVVMTLEGIVAVREKVTVPLKILSHLSASGQLGTLFKQKLTGLAPNIGIREVSALDHKIQVLVSEEYARLHHNCPECGGSTLEVTTMGGIVGPLSTHADTNTANCGSCPWKGIVHDLIPLGAKP